MESPDKFIVLKIQDGYKVFATWAGGYLNGDSWRLNSGIKSVTKENEYYFITGFSNSCYKCHEKSYGIMTSYGESVLQNILEKLKSNDVFVKTLTHDEFKEIYS